MKPRLQLSCTAVVITLLTGIGGCNPPPDYETCAAINYGAPTEAAPPLHADGRYFRDADDRAVLLRGVNATGDAKLPPFMTVNEAALLDPLPGWGINSIRLLFTWEAFEPTRCDYVESYLQYYEQVVQWAAQRNLYVIVDFHQDAYSRYNVGGCGEGFPQWAVSSVVTKAIPDNSAACADWGVRMILDADHHTTWKHFHSDREGVRTRYLDMVKAVAERLSDHPNVIGYELLNEPWGSDAELQSFFDAVGSAIRERHPSAILFVPAHALVSGAVKENNLARPAYENLAYSPHYYDGTLLILKNWTGHSVAAPLDTALTKADSWNAPMLLSEYGAPGDAQNTAAYMEALYQWLDVNFVSGTQWNYTPGWTFLNKDGWNKEDLSIVDDNGDPREHLFLPRPYPQYTAGTPQQFQRTTAGFRYSWQHIAAQGSTEIFLPSGYSAGKTLSVTGDADCSLQPQKLVCRSTVDGLLMVTLQ